MRRQDILNSPHIHESKLKKRRALLHNLFLWGGTLFAIFVGVGFLSQLEKINIQNIKIEGNKVADTKALEDSVWQAVTGNYLWLYSKSNLLFYPKGKIEEKLRIDFKILDNISIKIAGDRTLQIVLTERSPSYTWCGVELPIEPLQAGDCYFMDGTGYVFATAPYFSGGVYVKFFGALNKEEVLGGTYMPGTFLNMTDFISELKDMGLEPASFVNKGEKLELYLSSAGTPPDAPKIILNKNFKVMESASNLEAILTTEPLQTDFKKKYQILQYIDLSFGNKVYFKFNE